MKKILVAYDGSEAAREAARTAADLAKHLGARVTVFTIGGRLLTAVEQAPLPITTEEEFRRLCDEGTGLVRELGVEAQPLFQWVDAGDEIVRVAEEGGYDLIVMGHRGQTASINRQVLGSVAVRVINRAPCSVLVVRARGEAPRPEPASPLS